MLKNELLIVSAYKGMEQSIYRVCERLQIEPDIMEWEIADAAFIEALNKRFSENGAPDIIITRGAMANMIEENFDDIIMIRAEPDGLDLFSALCRAREHGQRIGALVQERMASAYNTEQLCAMLDLTELQIIPFRTKQDIEEAVRRGYAEGLDAMAGGGTLGERTGRDIHFPVFAAQTGELSLQTAIYQALGILAVRRREKQYLNYFRSAAFLINEGIAVIRNGTVTFINDVARTIFLADQDAAAYAEQAETEALHCINGQDYLVRCEKIDGAEEEHTLLIFHNASRIQKQEKKIRSTLHMRGFVAKYSLSDIQAESAAMRSLLNRAARYARTDGSILIIGESGTGKELLAQGVHNASARAKEPFVAINCASIPETLLESELFGYEEGAFSGAKKSGKPGLFELAHQGTIFLDEIDSLPLRLQGVLLRVLQEKEIRRIGAQSNLAVDCRVLAATNKDLRHMIDAGEFRTDLYYRLNIFQLQVPPLRDRGEDILLLARHFVSKYAELYHLVPPTIGEEDENILLQYNWPGNVRELENAAHRYALLSNAESVTMRECVGSTVDCGAMSQAAEDGKCYIVRRGSLEEMEHELIAQCAAKHGGNRSGAAEELGISRTTLWKKLRQSE